MYRLLWVWFYTVPKHLSHNVGGKAIVQGGNSMGSGGDEAWVQTQF